MLDALRHHKETPHDRDDEAGRGARGHGVPAPLAQALTQKPADEGAVTGKRLALALVLVSVTALLVWQVAAMNGLLPAGPLSRVFSPVATVRGPQAPAPKPRAIEPPPQTAPPQPADVTPPQATKQQPATRVAEPPSSRVQASPASPDRPVAAASAPAPAAAKQPAAPSAPGIAPPKPAGETDHFKLGLYY